MLRLYRCGLPLALQIGCHRDFGVEKARDWTTGLGIGRRFIKCSFVAAGNARLHVEMALGDRETSVSLLERHRAFGFDALWSHAGFAQFCAERHREASGMSGGNQLFRVGPGAVFKSCAE